jgi:hypothetical protein
MILSEKNANLPTAAIVLLIAVHRDGMQYWSYYDPNLPQIRPYAYIRCVMVLKVSMHLQYDPNSIRLTVVLN